MKTDVEKMMKEYVLPFIGLTVVLGAIVLCLSADLGKALDVEFNMQDELKNHYMEVNNATRR